MSHNPSPSADKPSNAGKSAFESIPEFDRAMRALVHVPKGEKHPARKPKKKEPKKRP